LKPIFPIGIFEMMTQPKLRFCLYFRSLHDY